MKTVEINRMVVKVGTTTIAEPSGRISRERVSDICSQVLALRSRGMDVALVSSGAIAAGLERLGLKERPAEIERLQAVAATGQGILMHIYSDIFGEGGATVGQVLLTQNDMTHRQQYLNARNTLTRMFSMGIIPIINENDTVATEEITFGENDMLAALVASLVDADLLVLLSDIEGLHTADPRTSPDAKLLRRVEKVTEDLELKAGESLSRLGSGGMNSKLQAARIATGSGVGVVIASGAEPDSIINIAGGETSGTYFPAALRKIRSKKQWIGFARISCGRLLIDEGAARAVTEQNRSLLPAGVVEVEGDFKVGDCVDIVDPDGRTVARGLANYSSREAYRIKGLRSEQVSEVLGEHGEEMVHRDALVVLKDV